MERAADPGGGHGRGSRLRRLRLGTHQRGRRAHCRLRGRRGLLAVATRQSATHLPLPQPRQRSHLEPANEHHPLHPRSRLCGSGAPQLVVVVLRLGRGPAHLLGATDVRRRRARRLPLDGLQLPLLLRRRRRDVAMLAKSLPERRRGQGGGTLRRSHFDEHPCGRPSALQHLRGRRNHLARHHLRVARAGGTRLQRRHPPLYRPGRPDSAAALAAIRQRAKGCHGLRQLRRGEDLAGTPHYRPLPFGLLLALPAPRRHHRPLRGRGLQRRRELLHGVLQLQPRVAAGGKIPLYFQIPANNSKLHSGNAKYEKQ